MHLKSLRLNPDQYPVLDQYPFNLSLFQSPIELQFSTPVTFFMGENGTGKSTLLQAIARRCNIHIWEYNEHRRYRNNRYECRLHQALSISWKDGSVPGSYFGSQIFHYFTQMLDEWAASNPGILEYFGGDSLRSRSHGQSLMAYFRSRYLRKGLYLLDEPETALSPKTQLSLLKLLQEMGKSGHAQFIIASHSPVLLACPGSRILSFDQAPIQEVAYEQTEYYSLYRDFLNHRDRYLNSD